MESVMEINLPFQRLGKGIGKVREMYCNLTEDAPEIGLMVHTDRVSAYNVKLKSGIPYKGISLNFTTGFWFQETAAICPNHLVCLLDEKFFRESKLEESEIESIRDVLLPFRDKIINRALLFLIADPIRIEAVVRNKFLGSIIERYHPETGEVKGYGIRLPLRLKKGDTFPAPIFTPTKKTEKDEPLTYQELCNFVGSSLARQIRAYSLSLYCYAQIIASLKGFGIDDTKFEFGLYNGRLIGIDEQLTGDASRYTPDLSKQIVRDYLDSIDFDRKTPIKLPSEIVNRTSQAYIKMCKIITGKDIAALV